MRTSSIPIGIKFRRTFNGLKKTIFLTAVLCLLAASVSAQETQQWFKGNLHTHSLWSDGNDFPEMITAWYVEHDYHFLALTDHNILSNREKWMPVPAIVKRGGKNAVEKYLKKMGEDWVELRDTAQKKSGPNDSAAEPTREVRLKKLAEYRGKFEKAGEFLLLTGEEISDSVDGLPIHMNATNLSKLIRPAGGQSVREAIANNMRSAIEQARKENREILVHLNHPNFGWAVTAEDLAAVLEEQFFEIYNGHPAVNQLGDSKHASLEKIWDIANTIRIDKLKAPPLMGLATDDSHYYHGRPGSQPGRGWVMVKAKKLDSELLMKAIKAGDFYASSGIELKSTSFNADSGKLTINIEPVDGETFTTTFVGTPKNYDSTSKPQLDKDGKPMRATRIYSPDVGKTFATVEGNTATYQLSGNELYVRAIVTSSAKHPNPSMKGQKKQAWVQPIVWK